MHGFYDCVALAFDFALTAYLFKLHRKECQTINNIKEAPSMNIGKDLNSILDKFPNNTVSYAVVRGPVTEVDETIQSSMGNKGVIQVTTLHEITATRFGDPWDNDNLRTINETRQSVPFALLPENSNVSVEVENPFDSIWESLLLPTSSSFTPANSTMGITLLGGLGTAKVLGVRKTEKILPIGTVVTGIGKIVKDSSGTIKLQEPLDGDALHPYILTTLSIDDLIRKLEFRKNTQRVFIVLSLSVGFILITRRLVSMWRRYKMKRLRTIILRERRSINLDQLCKCQTCLVCLINPREVILLNCGHVCVCADCVLKVNGLCPICREQIKSSHKAYIA